MKKLFTVFVFMLIGGAAFAQAHLNFYANGTWPMDGFKDSGYRKGYGFSIEYLSRSIIKTRRDWFQIRLGLGVEYSHHGNSQRITDLVFNTPNNDLGSVRINNQHTALYFAPKFIFNTGKISPYFDVFGASRTFTSHQINRFNKEVEGYERQSDKRILRNGRAHYGASVGLLYNLGSSVVFDARVSYSTGAGIKYIDLNSVTRDPNYESNVGYRVAKTNVSNVLVFRLGIMIRLSRPKTTRSSGGSSTPTNNKVNTNNNPPKTTPTPANPKPSTPPKKPAEVKPVPKPTPPPPPPPIDY